MQYIAVSCLFCLLQKQGVYVTILPYFLIFLVLNFSRFEIILEPAKPGSERTG